MLQMALGLLSTHFVVKHHAETILRALHVAFSVRGGGAPLGE